MAWRGLFAVVETEAPVVSRVDFPLHLNSWMHSTRREKDWSIIHGLFPRPESSSRVCTILSTLSHCLHYHRLEAPNAYTVRVRSFRGQRPRNQEYMILSRHRTDRYVPSSCEALHAGACCAPLHVCTSKIHCPSISTHRLFFFLFFVRHVSYHSRLWTAYAVHWSVELHDAHHGSHWSKNLWLAILTFYVKMIGNFGPKTLGWA